MQGYFQIPKSTPNLRDQDSGVLYLLDVNDELSPGSWANPRVLLKWAKAIHEWALSAPDAPDSQ